MRNFGHFTCFSRSEIPSKFRPAEMTCAIIYCTLQYVAVTDITVHFHVIFYCMWVYNHHKLYSEDKRVAYMYVKISRYIPTVLDRHNLLHAVHQCHPLPMQQMGRWTKEGDPSKRSLRLSDKAKVTATSHTTRLAREINEKKQMHIYTSLIYKNKVDGACVDVSVHFWPTSFFLEKSDQCLPNTTQLYVGPDFLQYSDPFATWVCLNSVNTNIPNSAVKKERINGDQRGDLNRAAFYFWGHESNDSSWSNCFI